MVCREHVSSYLMESPIGDIALVVCRKGLHSSCQVIGTDDEFAPDQRRRVKLKAKYVNIRFVDIVDEAVLWFHKYFLNYLDMEIQELPSICMDSIPSQFCKNVWMTLSSNTHPGVTITYSGIAELLHQKGYTGRAQAVGQALATNPFQIIVPCHRVVPKSGVLGNYAKGKKNKVKEWLLRYENVGYLTGNHLYACEIIEIGPKKICIYKSSQGSLTND